MSFIKKIGIGIVVLILLFILGFYLWYQNESLNSGLTMESRQHMISKFMDEDWTIVSESEAGRLIFCGAESETRYGLAVFRMEDDGNYAIQQVLHADHGMELVLTDSLIRNEDTWYAVAWSNNPDVETYEFCYRINQNDLEPILLPVENMKPVFYENPGNHFRLNMYYYDKEGICNQIC